MPEPTLEFEILSNQVFFGFIIDCVFKSFFYFIERKDISLYGHAGDLDGHFRGDAPAGRTACIDMNESGTFQPSCFLNLLDEILGESDIRRCGIRDTVGNEGLDDVLFPHLLPILSRRRRSPGAIWG